jgi:CheY-like chemotaxis protein
VTASVEDMQTPGVARSLDRGSDNVEILARIASELADAVALAHGQLVLERRTTELRSLLVELLDRTLTARDRRRCVIAAPRACLAWVDARRIERVILSLVQTALRATRDATIMIELEEAGGVATLSVLDAGEGMPLLEARETGILYAARCIVEAHGGTLSCTSDIGSRYTVELPLSERDDRLRVLIVDADPRQIAALVLVLRRAGYHVASATSGSSALCTAHTLALDVAIITAELPDVSARELVEQIRDGCPHLPIIVASEQACDHPRVVDALAATRGKFLAKPIDARRLLDELASCTKRHDTI